MAGFLLLCLVATMAFMGSSVSHHRIQQSNLERDLVQQKEDNLRLQVMCCLYSVHVRSGS